MMIVVEGGVAGVETVIKALQEYREMEMNSRIDLWQTTLGARLAVLTFERKEWHVRHHVMRLTIAWVLILSSGIPFRLALPAQGATPDPAPFSDLRQIKKFVSVEVQTQGTAEKVGLNGGDLTDLTRSAFLNKIPGIPLEGSRGPSADGTERLNQLGFFTCEVWTVGEEYIVAYHVDCNAGSYITLNTPGSLWNRALLGYGPKDEVSEAVRKGLRTIIEQFAMSFAKVRVEGGGR